MTKLKIGQKIYLKPVGNQARYNTDIKKSTISKIGRKFFYVDEISGRFYVSDLSHDGGNYTPDWKGYLSIKEIEDEKELNELDKKIKHRLGPYSPNITLNQAKEIVKILEL